MQNYRVLIFPKSEYSEYNQIVNANIDEPISLDIQARRKWWCFDNPNDGAFAVALAGNRVASTCYLSGKCLIVNGESYRAYEIGETATAPEHQRKGLFSKLVKTCTSYAFDNGADAVYGTPNAQSTPGYAKLGFEIIEDPRSHLFVSPNITSFLRPHTDNPINRGLPNQDRRQDSYQVAASEFYYGTQRRRRINLFSEQYFNWRFTGLSPNRYQFYRRGAFTMAVREAHLGKYKVLMVSDFGYDDAKPQTFEAITEIRKIFGREYRARDYSGIYFNCNWDDSVSRLGYGLKRLIHHRSLPICVATNGDSRLISDLRGVGLPQLSDCDIG